MKKKTKNSKVTEITTLYIKGPPMKADNLMITFLHNLLDFSAKVQGITRQKQKND